MAGLGRTISVPTVHHEVFCCEAALLPCLHFHSIVAHVPVFDQVDCSRVQTRCRSRRHGGGVRRGASWCKAWTVAWSKAWSKARSAGWPSSWSISRSVAWTVAWTIGWTKGWTRGWRRGWNNRADSTAITRWSAAGSSCIEEIHTICPHEAACRPRVSVVSTCCLMECCACGQASHHFATLSRGCYFAC